MRAISEELNRISTESRRTQPGAVFQHLDNTVAAAYAKSDGQDFKELYKDILDGYTAFIVDGHSRFFSVATDSGEGRAIAEPTSQTIIKGPKDAFTENIDKNIFLIRSRSGTSARIEDVTLGTVTHTRLSCCISTVSRKETSSMTSGTESQKSF